MFPLLHSIPADHPEHCILAGVLPGHGPNCQCSGCLTPKDSLGDLLAMFPVRTEETYRAFTEALQDTSGDMARNLYIEHLATETVDQPVGGTGGTDPRRKKRARVDTNAHGPSITDSIAWVKRIFHEMSFRIDLRPALMDFPAAGCGFAILGLSYDRLHMARTGAFKRLCLLVLAVYASMRGIDAAIALLNARFTSRGKHDGLDRYICRKAHVLRARSLPARQVLAERTVQSLEETGQDRDYCPPQGG